MPAKRRILVEFERQGGKRRKLAVAIDREATNDVLAHEIAQTVGEEDVSLEVEDGFELRSQDAIDMILDSDIVVARPRAAQPDFSSASNSSSRQSARVDVAQNSAPASSIEPALQPLPPYGDRNADRKSKHSDQEVEAEHRRFKIRLVTAELARTHAREALKDSTEPTNGTLAFDGEFVSGNTTVAALRQEAAQMFGWVSSEDTFDDGPCHHENTSSCSCALAQEVEHHGLFSTLHCRFTVDGTRCSNGICPYSHAPLLANAKFGMRAPHCSVCTDALAFPCPSCLKKAEDSGIEPSEVTHCPIVKNAGCGHLHHAHCLGTRHAQRGCPSGCPRGKIIREAVPFDQPHPAIVIVWNGDRIDRIPIPSSHIPDNGTMLKLKTDVVLSLVKEFLRRKSLELDGLSVQIFARDPVSETVSFTWTTLVSICPSSSHQNPDHRRFPLGETSSTTRSAVNGTKNFCVDLHTSKLPALVCGCTRLKDLFGGMNPDGQPHDTTVTLYVVKRMCDTGSTSKPKHDAVPVSKQSTYLLDPAWQPSVPQTDRGMAALLSSLFVIGDFVSRKGVPSENTVLAVLYSITRFPPAVRALGLLFLNVTPLPQEKAALSDALFHASKDFSSTAPGSIVATPRRQFETVRVLLGHILTITDVAAAAAVRPLESFSLVCSVSHKRLIDPVLLDSISIVERTTGSHSVPGGLLYRPEHAVDARSITELPELELRQILAQTTEFNGSEVYGLRLADIAVVTRPWSLENAGRDFSVAIRRANETELISRGPLELKSPSVVPPQIVLDSEGFLAVFTGRGCGSTRDVNFFRPTAGGDIEVDVNDVGHALQKIIEARQAEDTWEVDCFGGVPAKARTPDEAIVLCLDLSQSMNEKSAVGGSGSITSSSMPFDYITEALKVVDELLKDYTADAILLSARNFIKEQHESCHVAWKSLIADHISTGNLVHHLALIAGREVLKVKLKGSRFDRRMILLASFASASNNQKEAMVYFFEDFLQTFELSPILGAPPYDVPRNLVDPLTGEIGTGGILPPNPANRQTVSSATTPTLSHWVFAQDILKELKTAKDAVTVVLHYQGKETSWKLPLRTPTRVLYTLVNRTTFAKYSSYTLRIRNALSVITDSTITTIGSTALRNGGAIELSRMVPHSRKHRELTIKFPRAGKTQKVLLPADASALALISHVRTPGGERLSDIRLWHGVRDAGDGRQCGFPFEIHSDISKLSEHIPKLECDYWFWIPTGSQEVREESRSLTRLELLKELFNIFLNRVSSFDTSVSLVLGLVTFSDEAEVNQELTPIFENFRLELEKVEATGDTAMYDALDLARSSLVNFRRDLPNLRRRIIIVSDGEDTCSENDLVEVGSALRRDKIIVDSVQVGKVHSSALHAFSAVTGGYRFFPKTSLGDALSIFDLETMMYSAERPTRSKGLSGSLRSLDILTRRYPIDIVTIDQFPQRSEHPKLNERVRDVKKTTGSGVAKNDRTRRIMRELKALVTDPHPQMDVYVNDEDISFLKVVIQAPNDIEQCPYKGGCFLLTCDLPAEYPRDPPEIRFVTFILHPNVSKQGKVCIAELGRLWSSDIALKELFSLVYGLLLEPDLDNPLEIQASLKYYDDDGTFAHAAATAVKEHASKSRREWRRELEV